MEAVESVLALHHAWSSSASRRVRFALEEKELSYESILVNLSEFEQHSSAYLKLNPNGWVPTLVHDGLPIIESSVICEYLDEVFPVPPLRPREPRALARMRVWTKWVDEVVLRAFQVASWNSIRGPIASKWSNDELEQRLHAIPVPDRREDWRRMARDPFNDDDIDHAVANIRRTLERMEVVLSEGRWLAGETFSLADIHLSPYMVRIGEHAGRGILLEDFPRCTEWWRRLQARPAFVRAKIEALKLDAFR